MFNPKPIKVNIRIDILRRKCNEERQKRNIKINKEETFKYDECVICLTNPPSVLFCNCGHL